MCGPCSVWGAMDCAQLTEHLKISWPWDWADSPSWGSSDGLCDEHLGVHRNLLYFPNWTLCSQMHLSQSSLFSPLCKNEVFEGLPHTAPHSSIFACEWYHQGLKGKVQLSTVCSSHRNLFYRHHGTHSLIVQRSWAHGCQSDREQCILRPLQRWFFWWAAFTRSCAPAVSSFLLPDSVCQVVALV